MNIIAYGSLLNKASLEKTLQRPATLQPITLSGVERVFNAPFSGYAFCNLICKSESSIQAAFFELDRKEVKKFAEREAGSKLLEVLPRFFAFIWPEKLCQDLPVLQSYINVCERGAKELDINFWQGTQKPLDILDDRKNPLYH